MAVHKFVVFRKRKWIVTPPVLGYCCPYWLQKAGEPQGVRPARLQSFLDIAKQKTVAAAAASCHLMMVLACPGTCATQVALLKDHMQGCRYQVIQSLTSYTLQLRSSSQVLTKCYLMHGNIQKGTDTDTETEQNTYYYLQRFRDSIIDLHSK